MTMDMTSTMDIEGESMDITYAIDAKIKITIPILCSSKWQWTWDCPVLKFQ